LTRQGKNGTIISKIQRARGGGTGSVRSFHGWLATLTMSSLLLIGCTADVAEPVEETSMPVPTAVEAPGARSSALSSVPLESAKTAAQTPVYWLGESSRSVYLYREFRQTENRGDPITTAVHAMTKQEPLDEDYFNPWRPASSIGASISAKNVITVDISADAFEQPLDEGMARRAVQQLVYTATAAAASFGLTAQNQQIQVVILVDGRTGYKAFGHIPLGEPMVREHSLAAPVWIIDPQEGSVYADSKVVVNGRGISRNGTLGWEIREVGTGPEEPELAEYPSGSVALDGEGMNSGIFKFSVTLPRGTYELSVFQGEPGGERRFVDSKEFRVD
ncbi:MAG TPA: GerMN domain-containing protein, partial [Arthrobacter sp.]|nr:GerMN domain-containing protein [Arthrobacter sp.]